MNIARRVPLLAVGVLAAAFLNLALVFVPVGVGAQTSPSPMTTLSQEPCFSTSAAADQIIAACTALLRSGTLSATNTAAYYNRALAYYGKGQFDLAIAEPREHVSAKGPRGPRDRRLQRGAKNRYESRTRVPQARHFVLRCGAVQRIGARPQTQR